MLRCLVFLDLFCCFLGVWGDVSDNQLVVNKDSRLLFEFDKKNNEELSNYRTLKGPFKFHVENPPTRIGLDQLRISGSEQPSEREILSIKEAIGNSYTLVLVDLRSEDHFFLNGDPIMISSGIKKYGGYPFDLTTEKTLARKYGIDYVKIPSKNMTPPHPKVVNEFVELMLQDEPNRWIHLHCRKGWTRTTLFFIMADMLHNANRVSFDEIIERHHLLGGRNFAKKGGFERQYRFLSHFYRYCQSLLNGEEQKFKYRENYRPPDLARQ